jgi:hypothetical protein
MWLIMIPRMCNDKAPGRKLIAPAMLLAMLLLGMPGLLMADCTADINRDGRVDGLDFAIMRTEMKRKDCSATPCKSDLNGDGMITGEDRKILQSEMGRSDCLAERVEMSEDGSGVALREDPGEAAVQKGPAAEVKREEKVQAQEDEKQEETTESREETPAEAQEEVKEETGSPAISDAKPLKEVKKTKLQPVRFIDHDDGTVTDRETGLMWTRDADLPAETLLFYEALSYIEEMNKGNLTNFGYTDWRLPTLEELRSLKDFTEYAGEKKYLPPEGHPFENVRWMNFDTYYEWPTYFWDTKLSGMVSAYCRFVGSNTTTCVGYLWPVRGGRRD